MKFQVSKQDKKVYGTINLPASKSIANRALIIHALSYSPYEIQNLSDSDDTKVLKKVLESNTNLFDIGHAGTAMRFLTAFLSQIVGEWVVTGSERMKQRPIKVLVDALNELGAKIEYVENEGFPPLRIFGSHLKGKILELDGSISSQYISALLMIAPTLEDGLTLRLKNRITSRSYIEMTLKLMKQFGVDAIFKGNEIRIPQQPYKPIEYTVEGDWSGASYWYEILSLADEGEIKLPNLHLISLQGDCNIAPWFKPFGVESELYDGGIIIRKTANIQPKKLNLDFLENPDIAQTMAVLCVMKGVPFHFTGLETLKIKETNRIAALQNELAKFGAQLTEPQHGELAWDGSLPFKKQEVPFISTYHDHRMALAFAPAAFFGTVEIDDAMVVTKSYPAYYEDLKLVGFEVKEA
ncbi:3-phosphoshikimate 1-carboxyvinyltransferase [Mangrovibacterium marinum]|uniref:3-phosphoshikimate 1-carboxyvinyltransferase n=1 Tax=Mangrovibacterium marinum TaxID=1639118 RepID=A0A2T5C063_9BACT|nr:3-phosphoshikimate 1-carboxyvinyltransferase [Mangrovibacterium marinum]PTN07942.1 3-phosphoshikimate 1-carboxyvinyltransferase [Mangrovibacterium marinum]